jgi:CRP/FNR family transcriptional regulator/CRP/FNR family nitrogen fixation transcriptional regulator
MKAIPTADRLALAPRPARDLDGSHVRPVRSLAPRATLFREGDAAAHLYEVASGTLRLTRLLETGRRQVVAFATPGDIVGFPAGGLHHADCEALTEVTVIAHRRSTLEDAGGDPALHRRLQEAALAEISRLQDHLLMLARKGATGKLASFLGEMADRQGVYGPKGIAVNLEMPRADVADYLCLSLETVSRTLTRMTEEGLVARDGAIRLIVTDRRGLQAMASAG